MNKQKFKYVCLTFLFALTLLAISATSYADATIKMIKISELKTVLDSNKGKVIILDLWATWCPPCRKEIPGFINLYNKYQGKGVEILGIAFDENGTEVVPPFIKKMGINYPVYLDGGDIAQAYDLQAYPTTIVYGKDGKVANKHLGYVSEKEFDDEIGELLKK
ncbi:MAG TPA: TlpA family protein disulfide reductase [Candidatus Wunengus sp. YC60]|uniref:TlpA family protein disulfide reductase n=1 Tax=Candidatus Wunengus sp. YC60 TaxID=3367697 RepID=UPI0040286563